MKLGQKLAMAYRSQVVVDTCELCNQAQIGECPRCERLLCDSHQPQNIEERCSNCEAEFQAVLTNIKPREGAETRQLAASLCGFLALSLAAGAFAVSSYLTVPAAILAVTFVSIRSTDPSLTGRGELARAQFLREKKRALRSLGKP